MNALVRIDTALIDWTDAAMGRLEEHDAHAPCLLRELVVARVVCEIGVVIGCLLSGNWMAAPFILGLFCGAFPHRIREWKNFDADSTRDWTAALAEKYAKRGLRLRESQQRLRLFNIVFFPTVVAVLVWMGIEADVVLLATALILRYAAMVAECYVEASVPMPPPPPMAVPSMA